MSNEKQTVLDVQGMSCPSCIRHIKEALNDVEGVTGVDVRLADGRVLVKHGEEAALNSMVEALRNAGYEASPKAA
jgi:copper chaperone